MREINKCLHRDIRGIDFFSTCFDYSPLILMMSLTRTDAVAFLSVRLHFPGSNRVRLCGRPQGTEGLSALNLKVSAINLSVTRTQLTLVLMELC